MKKRLSREMTNRPSPEARSIRRAPSPNGLSVALPRKRFSSGFMLAEPKLATRPSSRGSIAPRTWMSTSVGPTEKPPSPAGIASRLWSV